jgi:hypothetical protein
MALAILRQTETLAVVKAYGAGSTTIDLQTDLLSSTMELDGGTQTVNISHISWYVSAGASDSVVITRGGTNILHLYQNGEFDFSGNGGFADTVNNTADIVVAVTGTGGCYLTLRKVSGYKSKIQPWTYGPYDNETSTTS